MKKPKKPSKNKPIDLRIQTLQDLRDILVNDIYPGNLNIIWNSWDGFNLKGSSPKPEEVYVLQLKRYEEELNTYKEIKRLSLQKELELL